MYAVAKMKDLRPRYTPHHFESNGFSWKVGISQQLMSLGKEMATPPCCAS